MSYRVLVPTAGTGSRLGDLTKYVNKSLVAIANRPSISHIIEQFPMDAEFVIALGHKGNLVRDFLSLAYPDRIFYFSEVFPFEGSGSGLGLSILSCKEYLQQPFIFTSCDTLVKGVVPAPDHNWMGYAEMEEIELYRTLEIDSGTVKSICEKGIGSPETHKPYIGLAGICDYNEFWEAMESDGDEAITTGESHGMRKLLANTVKPYRFTWFDTGNNEALRSARNAFREKDEPNILEKPNEAIWFIGEHVIKFSDDNKFISNRIARADVLKGYIPEITGISGNMYRYKKAKGEILSKAVSIPVFKKLLQYSKSFWAIDILDPEQKKKFQKDCLMFYREKTLERVELFYKNFNKSDGTEPINGVEMPTLKSLLDLVDWKRLADGLAGRFHGDFHFENILYSGNNSEFIFLDWRQDFAGSLTSGDIYYDLAKLLHGLIICHELIADNHFRVDWQSDSIQFDFYRKQVLVECENYYLGWLNENGYDRVKVLILTALVYLNIAALHHYPYSLLLYGLGKKMLYENVWEL